MTPSNPLGLNREKIASDLAKAAASFKKLNPHIFGQHQAEEGVQPIVERPRGISAKMNKTESEFSRILEAQKRKGEILRYEFQGMTLRWFDMRYTPDFVVFEGMSSRPFVNSPSISNGIKMIEVKGPHIHYRQQAIARFKGARGFWPEFTFEMHQKTKEGWKQIY